MKAITREEKIISGENLTPITRKEMFLAKAAGQNVITPTPITREEMFLSKITGGGGSVEGTAIPVGVPVEKIYFNTSLSVEETNAYLSQLTYVDGITAYPCYIVFANSRGFGIGVEKQEEETYHIFHLYFEPNGEVWRATYFKEEWSTLVTEVKYGEGYNTRFSATIAVTPSVIFDFNNNSLGTSLTDFNGFPAGAENEKIKNVLSITPFGASGGTSTNQPTAYTVSSVDELPSDAVDGSTAIVENNGLLGAWAFHIYYAPEDILYGTFYFDFYQYLLNENDGLYGNRYDAIEVKNIGYPYISFLFEGTRIADGIYDDGFTPPHNYISILKEPTDTNAINFINTYLYRIGSGKGLYTRENGEWVYKGEVA